VAPELQRRSFEDLVWRHSCRTNSIYCPRMSGYWTSTNEHHVTDGKFIGKWLPPSLATVNGCKVTEGTSRRPALLQIFIIKLAASI
ncbi:unnamed protein product, partial [Heterotrigona itama]